MNKKTLIIMVGVIGILAVSAAIFFYLDSKSSDTSSENPETAEQAEKIPNIAEAPEGFNPNSLEEVSREESFEYNDRILNPNTVATDPNPYIDQEIITRGWIYDTDEKYYSVISVNANELNGLIISKEQSIDLTSYVNPSPNPNKPASPVNLTGTLSNSGENGTLVYVVISVTQ